MAEHYCPRTGKCIAEHYCPRTGFYLSGIHELDHSNKKSLTWLCIISSLKLVPITFFHLPSTVSVTPSVVIASQLFGRLSVP